MTKTEGDTVTITIEEEDLLQSVALLESMRDFFNEQIKVTEGKEETTKALNVAIETMGAFWCEYFGEVDEDDK